MAYGCMQDSPHGTNAPHGYSQRDTDSSRSRDWEHHPASSSRHNHYRYGDLQSFEPSFRQGNGFDRQSVQMEGHGHKVGDQGGQMLNTTGSSSCAQHHSTGSSHRDTSSSSHTKYHVDDADGQTLNKSGLAARVQHRSMGSSYRDISSSSHTRHASDQGAQTLSPSSSYSGIHRWSHQDTSRPSHTRHRSYPDGQTFHTLGSTHIHGSSQLDTSPSSYHRTTTYTAEKNGNTHKERHTQRLPAAASSAMAWHGIPRPEVSNLSLSLSAASIEDTNDFQELLQLCECHDVAKNGVEKENLMGIYAKIVHLVKVDRHQHDKAKQLMAQFAPYVIMFMKQLSAYELRLILSAYAESEAIISANVSNALQQHVVCTVHMYGMQDLVDVLWSFAKNNIPDAVDLKKALERRILACISRSTHKNLANIFWSYATLDWRMPPALAKSLQARILTLGPGFNSQVWRLCSPSCR
jgi:hypothetical protein